MGRMIREVGELERFLAEVSEAPFLALDTETTGLDPHTDQVLLIQVGTAERQAVVDAQAVGAGGVEALFSAPRLFVLQHAKFDLKMLAALLEKHGRPLLPLADARVVDTLLVEKILRNGRRSDIPPGGFGLAQLAERYAGMDLDKSIREGFLQASEAADLGEAELGYARRDVEATWKVFAAQASQLREEGLLRTAAIEGAASFAFGEMERAGLAVDVVAWRVLVREAESGRAKAREALDRAFDAVLSRDLFGVGDLNYDSDQDVLEKLHQLGAKLDNTRREALIASGHPAALALVEYREHQKIVSTYGERFLEHVHRKTGRIHPTFKPIGATTGRTSSSEPNVQNIPADSAFRACFKAPPGRRLITADYAAAELRILAEVSGDPVFIRTFNEGGDLHAIVASGMFGKRVSKTENPELRARAKAINFGLAYGMGAAGLGAQIGASLDEAEHLLERYFRAYPKVRGYLEESARTALRRGWAETLAGRKLWFKDMERSGQDEGSRARVAKNMPIQGTNADITKLAMTRISRALVAKGLDAKLVNMVHDEILVECAESCADAVRALVESEMMGAGAEFVRSVPMLAEAHTGDVWSH